MDRPLKKWGVFCHATRINAMGSGFSPRYHCTTRAEARKMKKVADKECASQSSHYIARLDKPQGTIRR